MNTWRAHLKSGVASALAFMAIIAGCTPDGEDASAPLGDDDVSHSLPEPEETILPLREAVGVNPSPEVWLSPSPDVSVDARLLLITTDGSSPTFAAIRSALDYMGTPYDVLDATSGPALTSTFLADGTHGRYHGILLDAGDLGATQGSAFSDAEWMALTTYEATFGVRRVSLYTAPTRAYGLTPDQGGFDAAKTPVAVTCTNEGAAVFAGANCALPITIDRGYAYPARAMDGSTTPLLVDGAGRTFAAIRRYDDGREALALTFAQSSSATFTLQLAYGAVHWVTRGLFIGERRVYVSVQIDDLFLASRLYTGATYRITDGDLQAFADWQLRRRSNPLLSSYRATFAANGYGATNPNDPLFMRTLALGDAFAYVTHTWNHADLTTISYADALDEFSRNDQFLRGMNLPVYATSSAVTPNVSGLDNVNAMQAMFDAGIRQIVSNTSVPGQKNPSPNAGMYNAHVPGVLEIPRIPTELYVNSSLPDEWIAQYRALRANQSATYGSILATESDALFRRLMRGENDPWMFHQANIRDIGGGHSLLSDLLDAVFDKYVAASTFPLLSPTMDQLAVEVAARMKLDASGVQATILPGRKLAISVKNAATVPVTGLCTPGAENYGGRTISHVSLGDEAKVTFSLGSCNPPPPAPPPPSGVVGKGTIPEPPHKSDGGCTVAGTPVGTNALAWGLVSLAIAAGLLSRRRPR
jgi:hypothetical protein